MTIQKKSLINSLSTTKKALVASSPEKGTAAPAVVKPRKIGVGVKPAKVHAAKPHPARIG